MAAKQRLIVAGAIVLVAVTAYVVYTLSPWPSVWLMRRAYDDNARKANASMTGLIPDSISASYHLSYSAGDPDASFDVFMPAGVSGALPAVVWVHGGGFVAGSRSDMSGYLKILASYGFVTVAIDYSLAPEKHFPLPVQQTNAALEFLAANAEKFKIDRRRIFLAGDSAGAQIAAQTALVISDSSYARQMGISPGIARPSLRGLVLYCGPYDPTFTTRRPVLAGFKRTVLRSYMGARDSQDPRLSQMAVTPHVSSTYPPAFISVGNADPLASQSRALASTLQAHGVEADTLFFAHDHHPPLNHGYQMWLATDEARVAFDRSVAFLLAHR